MFDLLLNNGIVLFILCAIWIVLIAAAIWAFLHDGYRSAGVVFLLIGIVFFGFWLRGDTVYPVPANRVLLVIDSGSGKPIGDLRTAGVTGTQLPGTYTTYEFPAQSAYQFCPDFTPSASDGIGLKMNLCFVIDASRIDWKAEFAKRNGGETVVTTAWYNELRSLVAVAVQKFMAREITNRRNDVTKAVTESVTPWFATNKIPLTMVSLTNWDFDDPAISKAYNEALLAQTQVQQAQAEKAAAEVQRQTALYKADTQAQVSAALALANKNACTTLGMTTESACNQYLTLLWLNGLTGAQSPNVIVSAGGNTPSVSVPLQPQAPTPTAVPNAK